VFAFWVMLIDVGKGLLAVTVVTHLSLPGPLPSGPQWQAWLPVACGAAAVVGHVFPVWFGFRGGKGAATLLGIVAVLSPWGLVPVLAVWILCLVLTGYVGLSTIFGAAAFPVFVLISGAQPFAPLLIFGVVMALFIVFTHRSNLRRMFAGTESRFRKVMFLRKS
jgi:glycerol-3-phosphate acyltransferase PlsY